MNNQSTNLVIISPIPNTITLKYSRFNSITIPSHAYVLGITTLENKKQKLKLKQKKTHGHGQILRFGCN